MPSDLEIARAARLRPIAEIAARLGVPANAIEPYGRFKAKIGFDFIESLRTESGPEAASQGRIGPGDRDQPHAGGRGQDHDDGRARRRAEPAGHARGDLPARAKPGPELRPEGRRDRRRAGAGRADGGDQPPFHRRLPCHHRRQQPAGRDGGQPRLLGQRAGHRRAPHRRPPRARHQRPRAARDRQRARRRGQRRPARGRVRHHRRQRGHGGVLPGARPRRPANAARAHHRGRDARAPRDHRAAT